MVDGCVIHKSVDGSNVFQCEIDHAGASPKSVLSDHNCRLSGDRPEQRVPMLEQPAVNTHFRRV